MVENLNLSSLQHMSDDDWLHMFVSLYKLQHLTTLNLRNNDFTKVSKMQASPNYRICFQISSFSLFPEVEILNFSFCNLTFEQTENIFVKSALSKRIKTLILKNIDCSKVPEILLKSGTENLTTLDVSQEYNISAMTPVQLNSLLKMIVLRKSLTSLNLSGINLSVSSSCLMGKAGSTLSSLNLSQCLLTSFQCEDLFDQVIKIEHKLELVMDKIDLSRVYSKKFSKSVLFLRFSIFL